MRFQRGGHRVIAIILFPNTPPYGSRHRHAVVTESGTKSTQVTCGGETTHTRRAGQRLLHSIARPGAARLVGFDLHTPPKNSPAISRQPGVLLETLPLLVAKPFGLSPMPKPPRSAQQFKSGSLAPTIQSDEELFSLPSCETYLDTSCPRTATFSEPPAARSGLGFPLSE